MRIEEQQVAGRYQQLCQTETELVAQRKRLLDRLLKTKDRVAWDKLDNEDDRLRAQLDETYAQIESVLRDRIAKGTGRDGDHYKLEKIAQLRKVLRRPNIFIEPVRAIQILPVEPGQLPAGP